MQLGRSSKKWTARPIYNKKDYTWKWDLKDEVITWVDTAKSKLMQGFLH